jgi:hypothetical protein
VDDFRLELEKKYDPRAYYSPKCKEEFKNGWEHLKRVKQHTYNRSFLQN